MRKNIVRTDDVTIGIDLGDRASHICVLTADGTVEEEARVSTTAVALERRFSGLPRARVVIEAGTHSPWISRLLESCGHEVLVANPSRVRLVYKSERKGDRSDAEWLARIGRLDPKLLGPIQHRSAQAQADLAVIRARDALVRSRTLLVNHVRGAMKSTGTRAPRCSSESVVKRVEPIVPGPLRTALGPVLETIGGMTDRIRSMDREVEILCETRYPETRRLQQVVGVGSLTALTYVLTLGDPSRFPKSRAVGSYLGLVPRKDQSGDQDPELHITCAGDTMLRRLLVGSSNYILGPFGKDCDLRRKGLELAARGGKNAKKRAVVAVARKLAILLHLLWVTGVEYEPLCEANRRTRTRKVALV